MPSLDDMLTEAHLLGNAAFGWGIAIELQEKDGWVTAKVWSKDGRNILMTVRDRTKVALVKELCDELQAVRVQRDEKDDLLSDDE